MSKLWLTNKHCIPRAGTLPKQPLAVETCNTHTPSSGASVVAESACGKNRFSVYCFFSHPPTPLHKSCLSFLFISVSVGQSTNSTTFGGGGVLTLSRPSLGHIDPSGAAPWALIPLFLSRVGLAPPLSFSLYLSCTCGPCAPPPPPSHVGSAPTSVLCTAGAASLSPGCSLARDTPPPPRMPKKPLVSV